MWHVKTHGLDKRPKEEAGVLLQNQLQLQEVRQHFTNIKLTGDLTAAKLRTQVRNNVQCAMCYLLLLLNYASSLNPPMMFTVNLHKEP